MASALRNCSKIARSQVGGSGCVMCPVYRNDGMEPISKGWSCGCLVYVVCLVCLVYRACMVCFVQPNKLNRPDRPTHATPKESRRPSGRKLYVKECIRNNPT